MCIYLYNYIILLLFFISVLHYTLRKGGNLPPCPLPHCWSWDISSCPAFGLGLIAPAPLLLRPMDPAWTYTTSSPRSPSYRQQIVGHLRVLLLHWLLCPQLRWSQNASIRGPSSHMPTPRANVSCHLLRSLGRQARGWWPVQGAHPVSLYFSQFCSAVAWFCPPCGLRGYHQSPGQRDSLLTFSQRKKRSSPATLRWKCFLLISLCQIQPLITCPRNNHQILWNVWGWLSKLI